MSQAELAQPTRIHVEHTDAVGERSVLPARANMERLIFWNRRHDLSFSKGIGLHCNVGATAINGC